MFGRTRFTWGMASVLAVTFMAASATADEHAAVIGDYTLLDVPLASAEKSIKNDRKILLGSIGSDLWHDPGDSRHRFWMMTDRGPNGRVNVAGEKRRTFPAPEFTPMIVQVEVRDKEIRILRKLPLVDSCGVPVTGISNTEGRDEEPFAHDGLRRLPYNPSGLDTEGLVRTASGDFWLADEYGPSLVRCDANGKVLRRFVPAGLKLEGAGYPVADCLPGILARRKKNRGFEGLTLGPDGKTLYAIVQSPLQNPDKRTGAASRNLRLLAFDIAGQKPIAEYVYRLDPSVKTMVSGLAMLSDTTMLVLERTGSKAWLYKIDLAKATNILGGKWDGPATSPSLEATNDVATAGIAALPKTLAVDLSQVPGLPEKIEGIAVLDARTIAIANDNDFDIGDFDREGNNHGAGIKGRLCILRLASPLFER